MNWLRLKIPPPLYLAAFAGLMWLLHQYLPLLHWLPAPWHWAGVVPAGVALLNDLWALALFFHARTTFNPIRPDRTQALVTTGPYRYTRNPMYVGMLLLLLGWAMWLGSLSPLLLVPLFVPVLNTMQILPEEQILEQKFGQAYSDYKARTPRWLGWLPHKAIEN